MLDRLVNNSDLGKLLLRVSVGGLMLYHGVHKLQHGYGFLEPLLQRAGLPGYLSHGVLLTELIAPLFIVLGIYTRPSALIVAFGMFMALYLVHSKDLHTLTAQGGYGLELQALYLFGSLALFFFGAGRYSISRGGGSWR